MLRSVVGYVSGTRIWELENCASGIMATAHSSHVRGDVGVSNPLHYPGMKGDTDITYRT